MHGSGRVERLQPSFSRLVPLLQGHQQRTCPTEVEKRLKYQPLLFFSEALNSEKSSVTFQRRWYHWGTTAEGSLWQERSVSGETCTRAQLRPVMETRKSNFFTAFVDCLVFEHKRSEQILTSASQFVENHHNLCYSLESQTCSGSPQAHPIIVNVTALEELTHLTTVWVGLGWMAGGSCCSHCCSRSLSLQQQQTNKRTKGEE